jgi:hypothetical protein
MRTVNKLFRLGALLFGLCVSALTLVAADSSLLPDQFDAWKAEGPAKVRSPQELRQDWADWTNYGAILKESGFSRTEERVYRNGSLELPLRLLVFRDPSGAYEFYTALQNPKMMPLELGANSIGTPEEGTILVGNLVLRIAYPAGVQAQDLKELIPSLGAKSDHTPLPPLKDYLPTDARIKGSEKYALGPEAFQAALASVDQSAYATLTRVAGFESGAEAMLARFETGRNAGVLLLIEYPTPQLAEQHLHHLEGELSSAAKQAGIKIERKASLLSLVLAAPSVEYANKLREAVNYETQVTWNEGSHVATEPPMVVMIIKIFTFTGFFLLIATGLGVAFGVLRVFIKRYFPGKVFDRPEDIEVLQMGLSGKKIDPSDMY